MNPPAGFEASGCFRQTNCFGGLYALIVLEGRAEVDRAYDAYMEKMREAAVRALHRKGQGEGSRSRELDGKGSGSAREPTGAR